MKKDERLQVTLVRGNSFKTVFVDKDVAIGQRVTLKDDDGGHWLVHDTHGRLAVERVEAIDSSRKHLLTTTQGRDRSKAGKAGGAK